MRNPPTRAHFDPYEGPAMNALVIPKMPGRVHEGFRARVLRTPAVQLDCSYTRGD